MTTPVWTPNSWQTKPVLQGVTYADAQALQDHIGQLQQLPPLVTEREIDALKGLLHQASLGKAFILQGGDCSELFSEVTREQVTNKFRILLQMSVVLIHYLKKPVIRIGRIAGQYAKPRSSPTETVNGITLPAYRGDMINGAAFTEAARQPDPSRMLQAYHHSAVTLNYLRALASDGFANLHHPNNWQLSFMKAPHELELYQAMLTAIADAIQLFANATAGRRQSLQEVEIFTSHEALHLPYEAALTQANEQGRFYNLSTHLPWVGMRTLQADGAHVEYLRGVQNPIGIKVGPQADFQALLSIIATLNPNQEPGKIVVIHRFGRAHIAAHLPKLLQVLARAQHPVAVICDPMHGNTQTTQSGIKTRNFDDILTEVQLAYHYHAQSSLPLAGIHFEMTGDNVTECIGGKCGVREADLTLAYKSLVDPRLNYEQAMEMAIELGSYFTSLHPRK